MNQFLSKKIIAGIVAVALLVGVGVLISSGDTSSTTRNAALVVATPCTKPGQVTKVSKQSVVCAKTNTGSLWYATMKAKGKAQPCTKPGAIRKKSKIVWVCGVIKKKKLWQATRPLPPAVVASITVIEPGASQPTPALDSTQVATPETPVVADNTVLADIKIPDDKIVTQVIDDVTPPPASTPAVSLTCAAGGACAIGETGPGGGLVFYVATTPFTCGEYPNATPATTCKYLEAAPSDQSAARWCSNASDSLNVTSTAIGAGMSNTTTADRTCTSGAIQVAANYTNNNKDDWYLPSKDELNELCKYARNTGQAAGASVRCKDGSLRGGFAAVVYWSSSESYPYFAWAQDFNSGNQFNNGKGGSLYVRPVRAFSATMPATVAPKVCTGRGDCNLRDIGPGGGIVFYVSPTTFACEEDLDTVCRYLEVAITNGIGSSTWTPTTTAQWGCSSASVSGTSLEIGTGRRNTKIITSRNCLGTDNSVSAASIAAAYNGGNTTDWYLPSRKELDALCNEFFKGGSGTSSSYDSCRGTGKSGVVTSATNVTPSWSFASGSYGSSSEYNEYNAWIQYFDTGFQGSGSKRSATYYVRPVRAF